MRRTRLLLLLAIATLLSIRIYFGIRRVHELDRQLKVWTELAEQTRQTCIKSVETCEKITGKPCKACQ